MLNYIFVPNELVCTEPGGAIDWSKLEPYIWKNLNHDEILVGETEQYNQIRGPYQQVGSIDELQKIHQYYITIEAINTPIVAPANSTVLLYDIQDDEKQYVVLSRSQTFFQYQPLDNGGYTYTYSYADPNQCKSYIRPIGEWPINNARLAFTSNIREITGNEIYYYFIGNINNTQYIMQSPARFTTDQVGAKLFLSEDSNESIMTCPAHYVIQSSEANSSYRVFLQLDSPCPLPSSFYVEVF